MFLKKSIIPQYKKRKTDVEKWMAYHDNWLGGLWHGALRWEGSCDAQEAFLQWTGSGDEGPKAKGRSLTSGTTASRRPDLQISGLSGKIKSAYPMSRESGLIWGNQRQKNSMRPRLKEVTVLTHFPCKNSMLSVHCSSQINWSPSEK